MRTRTGRRALVTAVALVAYAVALLAPAFQGDGEHGLRLGGDEQAQPHEWADLTRACGTHLMPDDRTGVERSAAQFFARGPELMASDEGRTAAVGVFRSRDGRAIAVCRGSALPGGIDSFVTTVHPLRVAAGRRERSPLTQQVACPEEDRCVAALVVADRLDQRIAGVLAILEGGREVRLTPQRDRWIARVVEIEIARSTDEVPVERVLYLDEAGEHLAEWVPPTESRTPGLPPLTQFPGLEQECPLGASC